MKLLIFLLLLAACAKDTPRIYDCGSEWVCEGYGPSIYNWQECAIDDAPILERESTICNNVLGVVCPSQVYRCRITCNQTDKVCELWH